MGSESDHLPPAALGPIVLRVALFALLGIPLVAYLWGALNELVAGHPEEVDFIIAIPVLLLFLLLVGYLARNVMRLQADRHP